MRIKRFQRTKRPSASVDSKRLNSVALHQCTRMVVESNIGFTSQFGIHFQDSNFLLENTILQLTQQNYQVDLQPISRLRSQKRRTPQREAQGSCNSKLTLSNTDSLQQAMQQLRADAKASPHANALLETSRSDEASWQRALGCTCTASADKNAHRRAHVSTPQCIRTQTAMQGDQNVGFD